MIIARKKNLAFGLIEVLIATVILAIGLLGVAVLQQKAMLLSRDAENSANAAMLIAEMTGRMRGNINEAQKDTGVFATTSTYIKSRSSVADTLTSFYTNSAIGDDANHTNALTALIPPTDTNCSYSSTNTCTPMESAARDLLEWKGLIKMSLPNGVGIICFDSNPATNQGSLTCDGNNPGRTGSIKSIVYTIKVRWTDSSNTDRYLMNQTVFPCGAGSC
jgi:type IV pilus assembly protein PilV